MNERELYVLECRAHREVERIKREKEQYVAGLEEGVAIMFKAVLDSMKKCTPYDYDAEDYDGKQEKR